MTVVGSTKMLKLLQRVRDKIKRKEPSHSRGKAVVSGYLNPTLKKGSQGILIRTGRIDDAYGYVRTLASICKGRPAIKTRVLRVWADLEKKGVKGAIEIDAMEPGSKLVSFSQMREWLNDGSVGKSSTQLNNDLKRMTRK
ncbi:MAG: hypothetical protein WCW13_01435 [archaeon]|jgi:hypothetical protein